MYPETDIPPTQITEDHIKKISAQLPELPEQKLKRLMENYKLNQKLAKQILDSEYAELFETIIKESQVSPTTVATFLTETLKALKREGVQIENLSENQIREIFRSLGAGELTKEALTDIAAWLSKHQNKGLREAIDSLGLKIISRGDLEKIINGIIERNKELIKTREADAFKIIMGVTMKEVRGKADPEIVSALLKKLLEEMKRNY
jgi:glutamyl-tRNA(Gln) amidotransferase subunit E